MGKMQRDKGARGERELVARFVEHGFTARRYAPLQSSQRHVAIAPDVFVAELPDLWIESKRMKRVPVASSMRQAIEDAARTDSRSCTPLLTYREDGKEWFAVMRLDDLLPLLAAIAGITPSDGSCSLRTSAASPRSSQAEATDDE